MENSSPDYQKRIQELEERLQAAEQRAQAAEQDLRKTTLAQFLDLCHVHLYSNLVVQDDAAMSTKGDPSNAENKVRPVEIQPWKDFPKQQEKMLKILADTGDFVERPQFDSTHALQERGAKVSSRKMGSEIDLHIFERSTVEDQVSLIIKHIYDDPHLQKKYKLKGQVQFENHPNTLSPAEDLGGAMRRLDLSKPAHRRSPRLLAIKENEEKKATSSTGHSADGKQLKYPQPRADQFCVYDVPGNASNPGHQRNIHVTEYKAPHKLTLGHIYEGLEEMKLEDVVLAKDMEGAKERCRRLVAAIITQEFSYMILAGLEFGCIRTGEATIFLRVPEDPKTVYYSLSVPKHEIGESTGWDQDKDNNLVHLTTIGQMLAFTLQALQAEPRGSAWTTKALETLPKWNVIYEEVLETIPEHDVEASEFLPSPDAKKRASPIRVRKRSQKNPSSCASDNLKKRDESESDDSPPKSPSRRQPSSSSKSVTAASGSSNRKTQKTYQTDAAQQFCTHLCLLGLMNRGVLDQACPNVHRHGVHRHKINRRKLVALLREQLSKSMDENFVALGRPGSRGMLFALTLASHGYTIAAKCSPPWFADHLRYEASVYRRLRPIQGADVPACLGYMDLPQMYLHGGRMVLSCALLCSFGGTSIHYHVDSQNIAQLFRQFDACLRSIHALGVIHRDARSPNVLRDIKTGRVMIIDFERATMGNPRPVLGVMSPNGKKKSGEDVAPKRCRQIEGGQLKAELSVLVKAQRGKVA